jgi:hypothetical protein
VFFVPQLCLPVFCEGHIAYLGMEAWIPFPAREVGAGDTKCSLTDSAGFLFYSKFQ